MKLVADFVASIPTILWWLVVLYAILVSLFILLENRSPHLTFAWLLLFFVFPIVGVVIYIMFGQDYRAFSRKDKLLRQELKILADKTQLADVLDRQDEEIKKLKAAGPPVYSRILELTRRNSDFALFPHNTLEILQNGHEKYACLLADMEAAQHSIHMEYYEWASDEFTERVKQLLLAKVKEGVEVRLLYDPIGSFYMLKQAYVSEMNAGGIKMVPYSPLYNVHTISYRNHRKIVVIDGKIGYTGGLNMAETYLTGPKNGNFTGWRDTHARFSGEAVWGLQASFIVQWFNTTAEKLVYPVYFPPLTKQHGYLPLQIVNSGPDSQWRAIRELYFAMITAAQQRIYIQSPFFILDDSLAEALSGAARAGIEVKIMLAPDGPDGFFAYRAGFTYAQNMADAGVHIYHYFGDYFHVKTIMIDSALCSIGSANMDIRSFSINYESNLIIYDEKATQELEQDFMNDLKHCVEFDVDVYTDGNFLARSRDSFFRLFSPLL